VTRPAFPGAIGVSHLRVYDSQAADGLRGGTPHVHSVCTEAYYVIAGSGAVQALGPRGFEQTPLESGAFVWFTPGTIHRLVNGDGALEILVIMQNAGLPEAGDMVIAFPEDVLLDEARYWRAAMLPEAESTTAGSGESARKRRDLGVEGFLALRERFEDAGAQALEPFYDAATRLLAPRAARFRALWERGPHAAALATDEQLAALAQARAPHLRDASLHRMPPPPDERRMGCCGTLGTYVAGD
jgi:mannose-6-phosphate isomerase-like protein (cupin superfamily)